MAKIRRCPTCKVVFPTVDAVNDHYKKTSHTPLPFKCGSCERVYKLSSLLQKHIRAKHPQVPSLYDCKPCNRAFYINASSILNHFQSEHPHLYCEPCKRSFETSTVIRQHYFSKRHRSNESKAIDSKTATSVIAQMDAIDLNSRRDDDDSLDTNVSGWSSPKDDKDCNSERDFILAENHPSALLNGNDLKPLPFVSEYSPSPSSSAAPGPSSTKLDKATAVARAALRNRFSELGDTTVETTPLLISNLWGPRKANSFVSNLDGSNSVATNLTLNSSNSNEKEVEETLNPLDKITRSFACPGCLMDFKRFSGFVLHIENRSCMSSMCREIKDQLNTCVTQLFNALASSDRLGMNP